MTEKRRFNPGRNSWLKYNFDIEAKGQGHVCMYVCMYACMYVTHCPKVIHSCAKHSKTVSKDKKAKKYDTNLGPE